MIEIKPSTKHVFICMSGGADSTLMAYMIAKNCPKDVKIWPIHLLVEEDKTHPRNQSLFMIDDIIEEIEVLTDNNFEESTFYYSGTVERDKVHEAGEYVRERESIPYDESEEFAAITSNLPDKMKYDDERDTGRDTLDLNPEHYNTSRNGLPWIKYTKHDIARVYEEEGLLDNLFPLTFSCVVARRYEDGKRKHCETCWWCEERFIAFGRYI